MKKKRNVFIIIFICLFLSLGITLRADSGWDGSYDSGGSSWDSGGSSWDSSSGSSWSSSDSSSSGGSVSGSFGGFVVFIMITIIIIIVFLKYSGKGKQLLNSEFPQNTFRKETSVIPYNIEKIKEILPDFDKNEFCRQTFQIYKDIQVAWMNFDYDTIKKNTTNELFNLYKSELLALKAKKQKNIMENFSLLDFEIMDMEKNVDNISLKIRMLVTCNDYIVDKENNIVRGNKNIVGYDYEMTFTKGLSSKDNKCPNCNAPLENNITSTCPYCGSTVISDNHDWVLSKKQVINQNRN